MTAKQLPGVYAPDGSLYITLTDGAGTLATTGGGLTIGTSTITSGTDGRVLYDNAGVLGEKTVTGTGSAVLATSPTLTTPALGVATGTSLAIGGATLGSNALAVTGTASFNSTVTLGDLAITGKIVANTAGVRLASNLIYGFSSATDNSTASDTTLSRNAAGVVQFGTTAANASGSWLAANGSVATGTITTSQPFSITQTWNGAGVTFQGLTLNYTDTASSALSAALEIQYGGQTSVRFGKGTAGYTYLWMGQNITPSVSNAILQVTGSATILSANGSITASVSIGDSAANYLTVLGGGFGAGLVKMPSAGSFGFTSSTSAGTLDTILVRDAANTLAQRNGTTAQTLRVYGSWTDASNGDWLSITKAAGGTATISATKNGSGTAGALVVGNAMSTLTFSASVGTLTYDGNTFDFSNGKIVASGSTLYLEGNNVAFRNYAESGAPTVVAFGGLTSSFPALKRNATVLEHRLADDSDYGPMYASTVRTAQTTVANLPAASTAGAGARAFVTDASTTLILGLGGTVAGGGANKAPVYSDGTNWIYG